MESFCYSSNCDKLSIFARSHQINTCQVNSIMTVKGLLVGGEKHVADKQLSCDLILDWLPG